MKLTPITPILLASTLGMTSNVLAEEATTDKKLWSGEVSVTFISNNGNTRSQNMGLKSRAVRDGELWRSTYKLEGSNESTDDERTAEKYFGSVKFDRKLNDVSYVFGLLEHEDDSFSGYDYQTSLSAGYGRKLINTDAHKLEMEVGPGYRRSVTEEEHDVENEATLRGAANYDWAIDKTSSFRQEVSVESGEESTISKSLSRYKKQLNGSLSLTLSYEVKHTSKVPSGTDKSDSTTAVALDYSF